MNDLQRNVEANPYSIIKRLDLAKWYYSRDFPDLAAGEAYLALLLIDEVTDESGEYHVQATEAAEADIAEKQQLERQDSQPEEQELTVREWLDGGVEAKVYNALAPALYMCGCFRSAAEIYKRGIEKVSCSDQKVELEKLYQALQSGLKHVATGVDTRFREHDELSDEGKVRREVYPWNEHEPDRCSEETIQILNQWLENVAPKLEVRAMDLPNLGSKTSSQTSRQLGLYAKVDIAPGEHILQERSLLTGTNRMLSEVCDACSLPRANDRDTNNATAYCTDCTDTTIFCSSECHDIAMSAYHPAVCDTDALFIAKDPKPADAANTMYAQLLLRVFAMSITQDVHPLDLLEIKYLCGEFNSPPASNHDRESLPRNWQRTLPFTFYYNIQLPLHFLEKMDINIFEPPAPSRYSTSVVNTIYAKLRGVASAKQHLRTGLPDVAAVHPLWCLANHSCAPNVRWEWNGNMRFWAREIPVEWGGRRTQESEGGADLGRSIKAGEEILSHYCDIDLPVKERREWAAGALGGECRCRRCIWESEHTEQRS